jgi:hypothetical protein
MSEQNQSFLSKLNPFSKTFKKVENVSAEAKKQSQIINNSVGYSESDASEIKQAMHNYFKGNADDYDGSIQSYQQAERVVSSVNKGKQIKIYREMEKYPEISDGLDYICDEAIFVDKESRVVTLSIKRDMPPHISRIIQAEFDYITLDAMKLHKNAWRWFRRWVVDAEFYGEKILNDNQDRIVSVKMLNPSITYPIYNGDEIMYYLQKDTNNGSKVMSGMNYTYSGEGDSYIRMNKDQVAYTNFGEFGANFLDVRGFLEPAKLPFNHLKNLEIALLLYRLVRAPERYVFNVEVGKMPVQKGREYLNRLKEEHRKEEFFDADTGEVDVMSNFMTVLEDFWFMKRQGDGSSVDTIGGNMDLGNINDVDHFLKKLYVSIKLPKSRWSIGEVEGQKQYSKPGEITYEEHKFSMMVGRMKSQFMEFVRDVFMTQLKLDGVPSEYISRDFLSLEFTNANLFQKEKELMVLESEMAQFNSISGSILSPTNKAGLFSEEYIMRRIMGDSEYDKNKELRDLELEKIIEKELEEKEKEVDPSDGVSNDSLDNDTFDEPTDDFGGDEPTETPTETPTEEEPTDEDEGSNIDDNLGGVEDTEL